MTSVRRSETRIPPGLVTLAVGLLAWELLSLFFPPVIFPGPWTCRQCPTRQPTPCWLRGRKASGSQTEREQ